MKVHEDNFFFKAEGEVICATVTISSAASTPSVIFLHGAGSSDRNRISYLAQALAKRGLSSLRFDFPGHGESSGELKHGSIVQRINIAFEASQFLDKNASLAVVGTSMGGHIAAELTSLISVESLVLFCPAAYGSVAIPLKFNKGFTEFIRSTESWKGSPAFKAIRRFKGRLLHVIGDSDNIVPTQVTTNYKQASENTSEKAFLTVPNAPHALHAWLEKHEMEKELLINILCDFLTGNQY
jgi:uncharacterized protein